MVGDGTFAATVAEHEGVVLIDEALTHLLDERAVPPLGLPADESAKTLSGVEGVVLGMRDRKVRRTDRLLAIGGGVVQDVATFAAAVYMRGIGWDYVPTTLMAMADSCIGGKSSINVGEVKNLVGGFHPPRRIVIDPLFLRTLPASAISAGLAEAVKITFCRDIASFEQYLTLYASFADDPAALILHALRTKAWFIEVDEFDQKERRLLNFGHTFGHALESALSHRISHGAGVALGILCALEHPAAVRTPHTALLTHHCTALLAAVPDLGQALEAFDSAVFERAFRSDKKHSAEAFTLILPVHESVAEVSLTATPQAWSDVLTCTRNVLREVAS